MPVTTFLPNKGPHSGSLYSFAREYGTSTRGGQMDETSITDLVGQDGSFDARGMDRLLLKRGTIQATFDMNEWWLKNGTMGDYSAAFSGDMFKARAVALRDVMLYVVLGGNGTLTVVDEDGFVLTCRAKITQWSFPREVGQATARPQLTWTNLSGMYTTPSNTNIPVY